MKWRLACFTATQVQIFHQGILILTGHRSFDISNLWLLQLDGKLANHRHVPVPHQQVPTISPKSNAVVPTIADRIAFIMLLRCRLYSLRCAGLIVRACVRMLALNGQLLLQIYHVLLLLRLQDSERRAGLSKIVIRLCHDSHHLLLK
jgi:hypothetical protein